MLLLAISVVCLYQSVHAGLPSYFLRTRGTEGCTLDDGRTFDVGETFHIGSKCIIYKCRATGYEPIKKGCQKPNDDSCVPVDRKFRDGCFKYQCVQEGNTLRTILIKGGCAYTTKAGKAFCQKVDDVRKSTDGGTHGLCVWKQCMQEGNYFSLINIETQCRVGRKCFEIGNTINTGRCRQVTCHQNEKGEIVMRGSPRPGC